MPSLSFIKKSIIFLIIVSACIMFVLYSYARNTPSFPSIPWLGTARYDTEQVGVRDTAYILNTLTSLQVLISSQMVITQEIEVTLNYDTFQLPGGIAFDRSKTQAARVSGKINAGIDLSRITQNDIRVSQDSVEIHIPSSYIVSIERTETQLIRNESSLALALETVLPQNRLALENSIQAALDVQAKDALQRAACNEQILTQSDEQASNTLRTMFMLAGFQSISIITQGEHGAVDSNCAQ